MLKKNVSQTVFTTTLQNPILWIATSCFVALQLIFFDLKGLFSSSLGLMFGLSIFFNLCKSQHMILSKQKKGLAFSGFFIRLALYAIPLSLANFWNSYFNIWLVLLSLWWFQLGFILKEARFASKSLKKLKIK